jgi:hypothetical protein
MTMTAQQIDDGFTLGIYQRGDRYIVALDLPDGHALPLDEAEYATYEEAQQRYMDELA